MATMFAFAVSAQTTTADKPKSETQKVEKTAAVKMNTPEKKEVAKKDEVKKNDAQASTVKVHKAHPVKRDMRSKAHSNQANRNRSGKTTQLTTKAPAETKSEKNTPVVK